VIDNIPSGFKDKTPTFVGGTTGGSSAPLGPPPWQNNSTHSVLGLQLCYPYGKCVQSWTLVSDPEQATSSNQKA
jgi:hypothetical protein